MSKKPQQANQDYQIKPKPRDKFKSSKCRELIQEILQQKIKNATYQDVTPISKDVAETIKNRLKLTYTLQSRYKFIVHVAIGQLKGKLNHVQQVRGSELVLNAFGITTLTCVYLRHI